MNRKKILLFILILLLIGFGIFWFFNRETINRVLNNGVDFGTFFGVEPQSQNNIQSDQIPVTDVVIDTGSYEPPILRQISLEPVSGFTNYKIKTITKVPVINPENFQSTNDLEVETQTTTVRFQERATGHIYDVFEKLPNARQISNITMPKIYETIFTKNINEFITKTLDQSFEQVFSKKTLLSFTEKTDDVSEEDFIPETTANTIDLSNIINQFIYITDINKIVYPIIENQTSFIFKANPDRTEETLIKTLAFNEFNLSPINKDEILLTTKASQKILGYAYILNINTGSFEKILDRIAGLTVNISPKKDWLLYTESGQTRPILYVYNLEGGFANQIEQLDSLPSEKCVFANTQENKAYCFGSSTYKSGIYPDDWYKGKIFNQEILFELDFERDSVDVLWSFDNQNFDIMNTQITSDDSHIIFQNKYDLTLWSLDLRRI
jgi:hypothetical protein